VACYGESLSRNLSRGRSRSETEIRNSWPVLVIALIAFVTLASSLHSGFSGSRVILKQMRANSMGA
jgi:hypothetical protein